VYFDVVKFNETNNYGKLSGRNIEDMLCHNVILMGKVIKEILKILRFEKSRNATYHAGLHHGVMVPRMAFRMCYHEH
jgi:hypothetical protein